jgi:hypothetical protein
MYRSILNRQIFWTCDIEAHMTTTLNRVSANVTFLKEKQKGEKKLRLLHLVMPLYS